MLDKIIARIPTAVNLSRAQELKIVVEYLQSNQMDVPEQLIDQLFDAVFGEVVAETTEVKYVKEPKPAQEAKPIDNLANRDKLFMHWVNQSIVYRNDEKLVNGRRVWELASQHSPQYTKNNVYKALDRLATINKWQRLPGRVSVHGSQLFRCYKI